MINVKILDNALCEARVKISLCKNPSQQGDFHFRSTTMFSGWYLRLSISRDQNTEAKPICVLLQVVQENQRQDHGAIVCTEYLETRYSIIIFETNDLNANFLWTSSG